MLYKSLVSVALFFLNPVHLLLNGTGDYTQTDGYIQCEEGWFSFGGKCYKIFGVLSDTRNWQDASKHCKHLGGHLATIQSEQVHEFLFAFLLLEGYSRAWIGLNNLDIQTQYKWEDGTKYDYSNWNPGEPSGTKYGKENCVEMILLTVQGEPGKWNDAPCTDEILYICQVDEDKQEGTSRDPTKCLSEIGGGWKFEDSCYNVVEESMIWEDAEKYCQVQYKGHLVKILSWNVNYFLKYIISNFSTDIWIGIKMKDQFQQKFSSGWYAVYTNWQKSPQNFVDGTCVIRSEDKSWKIVPCTKKYPFICEKSTVSPPVLKTHSEISKCPEKPEDWRDLGGEFCYFIDITNKFNLYRANFECLQRGGSLASFHSKAELDALAPFLKRSPTPFTYNPWTVFIGLYRLQDDENVLVWADGSQMNYTSWFYGDSDIKDKTCVKMYNLQMKWYGADCEESIGYICSVRKITPAVTKIEADGNCINGITFRILIGAAVFILLVVIFLSVSIYYFQPWKLERPKNSTATVIHLQPLEAPTNQQMCSSSCVECGKQITEDDHVYEYLDMDDGYEEIN